MRPTESDSAQSETTTGSTGPDPEELARFLALFGEATEVRETMRLRGVGCTDVRLEALGRQLSVLAFGPDRLSAAEYTVGLLAHLADQGIPCPTVLRGDSGARTSALGPGTGVLLALPSGAPADSLSVGGCRALGAVLGRMHSSAADFSGRREPLRGPRWWRETAQLTTGRLPAEDQALLREELQFQGLYRFADLPRGAIHGSLGRENVLFDGEQPVGLAGFGEAVTDVLLLDLAAAANAWCSADGIALDADRLGALLGGYHTERPLRAIERGAWPVVVRAAALDSWLATLDPRVAAADNEAAASGRAVLRNRIDNEAMLQLHWV